AREAFVQALQLTAAISAIALAGTAILALVLLRRVETGAEAAASTTLEHAIPPSASPAQPEPQIGD
ncbi:MAG: hypothetical protein ACRDJE_19475, partial [Dehalococcoidia bacterium]